MAAPEGNKFALGNNGGRPPIYDNPEDLANKVVEYFNWIEGEKEEVKVKKKSKDDSGVEIEVEVKEQRWVRYPEHPTVTGLSLFLGFEARSSLYDYAEKQEFSYIVKRAIHVVEHSYEQGLREKACTGQIFALKNMGWEDKTKKEVQEDKVIKIEGVSNDELDEILED